MTTTHMASPTLIWVCVDCMFHHHGLLETEPLDLEVDFWALYRDQDVDITAGMLAEHHEADCPNFVDGEWIGIDDEPCEQITFTWHACEACGSTLGGSREAFTVWYRGDAS